MSVENRPYHDDFFDVDMKMIYGDVNGIVRDPPSQAELMELQLLCARLWGEERDGRRVIPELESKLKGHLRIGADQHYEIRYAPAGGQFLQWVPLRYVPKCRIWLVRENGETEALIAMTDVTKMPDDEFADLNKTVIPRILEVYPHGHFEWQE